MSEAAFDTKGKTGKQSIEVLNLNKKLYEVAKNDERFGKQNSVSYVILSSVIQGNYERALKELEMMPIGLEAYKEFEIRSRRFINHAKSLVEAIRVKYEVCLSDNISKNTQKELGDNIHIHFLELRKSIVAIEKIQKSVRAVDMSSTKIFLRASFFCIVLVFTAYALLYMYSDLQDLGNSKIFQYFQWAFPTQL